MVNIVTLRINQARAVNRKHRGVTGCMADFHDGAWGSGSMRNSELQVVNGPFFMRISTLDKISGMSRKPRWPEKRSRNRPDSQKASGFPSLRYSVQGNKGIVPFRGIIEFFFLEDHYHVPNPRPDFTLPVTYHPQGPVWVCICNLFPHDPRPRPQWSWCNTVAALGSWEGRYQPDRIKDLTLPLRWW